MELFRIKVNYLRKKSPILDVRLSSEYASGIVNLFKTKNLRRSRIWSKNVALSISSRHYRKVKETSPCILNNTLDQYSQQPFQSFLWEHLDQHQLSRQFPFKIYQHNKSYFHKEKQTKLLFVPSAPFFYPLKTSENRLMFSGGKNGCIGSEWVKMYKREPLEKCHT